MRRNVLLSNPKQAGWAFLIMGIAAVLGVLIVDATAGLKSSQRSSLLGGAVGFMVWGVALLAVAHRRRSDSDASGR